LRHERGCWSGDRARQERRLHFSNQASRVARTGGLITN
jgi:hypothetical protein